MSKLSKLIRNPQQFFADAFANKFHQKAQKNEATKKKVIVPVVKEKKYLSSLIDLNNLVNSESYFVYVKGSNPYLDIIERLNLKVTLIDEESGKRLCGCVKGIELQFKDNDDAIHTFTQKLANELFIYSENIIGAIITTSSLLEEKIMFKAAEILTIQKISVPNLRPNIEREPQDLTHTPIYLDNDITGEKEELINARVQFLNINKHKLFSLLNIDPKISILDLFLNVKASNANKRADRDEENLIQERFVSRLIQELNTQKITTICNNDIGSYCQSISSEFIEPSVRVNNLSKKIFSDSELSLLATLTVEISIIDKKVSIQCVRNSINLDQDFFFSPVEIPSRLTEINLTDFILEALRDSKHTNILNENKFDKDQKNHDSSSKINMSIPCNTLEDPLSIFLKNKTFQIVFYKPFQKYSAAKYLPSLINANIIQDITNSTLVKDIYKSDIVLRWGVLDQASKSQRRILNLINEFQLSSLFVEDGFIRSLNIGLSGEPTHSIIVDDIAPYYDSRVETRLQKMIEGQYKLSDEDAERSRKAIKQIVTKKLSKYNHAPTAELKIGKPNHKKILIIDQRYGDKSVEFGQGSPETFEKMLFTALTEYPEYEIILKLHPDATKGGKASYLNDELLAKFSAYDNIYKIGFEINPYSLFNEVDKVFVCTSGVGFEALLACKEVHCFGLPFYSNRGLTVDYQKSTHRTQHASLEQVFFCAYFYLSRYAHPETGQRCELEELINSFAAKS